MTYKTYTVNIRAKYPPCGEKPCDMDFEARTAKEAIKMARDYIFDIGGHTRQDGPLIFRAQKQNGF